MKNTRSIMLILMLAACSTSHITNSWKAQNTAPQKYNKIMVVGLIREADRSMRQDMENHLAGDLTQLGYTAVSSLHEYGPAAFDNLSEAETLEKLKNSGVDAVITIVLLDKDKERKYYPGSVYYSPYWGYYYNRFWGYRMALAGRIDEPGYYVTNTRYFWESNFYDMVNNQQLVYSVQTQSFDPASTESLGHEYGKMIVKSMVKENVLQQQAGAPGS